MFLILRIGHIFLRILEQSHVFPQEPFRDLLEKIMPMDIMAISIERRTIVDMKVAIG